MNILITGGKGFIGSTLCAVLDNKGYNVSVIDNRKKENYIELPSDVEEYKIDIRDYSKVKEAITNSDFIVHLAAISRVIWGEQFPQRCVDVNIKGTVNILEAIKKLKEKPKLIIGSSREVYGETNGEPVTEEHQLNPTNIYAISKAATERLTKQYSILYNLQAVALRFSNVYGNLNDIYDRVTPKFIIKALLEEPICINGGKQIFDFTHIDDTIDGITKTIDYFQEIPNNKPFYDVFHITTGTPSTLYDLVNNIETSVKKKIKIEHCKRRDYDVEKFVGDTKKAEKILKFKSKIDFKTGIKNTIKIYSEELKNGKEKFIKKYKEDSKCELL